MGEVERIQRTKLNSKLSSLARSIEWNISIDKVKPASHIWSTISRAACTYIEIIKNITNFKGIFWWTNSNKEPENSTRLSHWNREGRKKEGREGGGKEKTLINSYLEGIATICNKLIIWCGWRCHNQLRMQVFEF